MSVDDRKGWRKSIGSTRRRGNEVALVLVQGVMAGNAQNS